MSFYSSNFFLKYHMNESGIKLSYPCWSSSNIHGFLSTTQYDLEYKSVQNVKI